MKKNINFITGTSACRFIIRMASERTGSPVCESGGMAGAPYALGRHALVPGQKGSGRASRPDRHASFRHRFTLFRQT